MASNKFELKCYELPIIDKEKDTILKSSFNYIMSKYTPQPLCSVGYNYFFHQSYTNFSEIVNKQKGKQFYWVVNGFEMLLTSQDKKNDLIDGLKKYFNTDAKISEDILTNPLFLNIWELLMVHDDLLDVKTNKVNIISNNENIVKESINSFSQKSFNKSAISYGNKSYDLGIFNFDNFDTLKNILDREPLYFPILLKNVYILLEGLKNGGNIIVNINDTFTTPTLKLITLLRCLFDSVFIHKPYYIRPTSSEKYLVCIGLNEKSFTSISKKLNKFIEVLDQSNESTKMNHINDMMSDINIPNNISLTMTFINTKLGVEQHKYENNIITYINSNDYFGDDYGNYSDSQEICTEYFLSTFLPLNKNDYVDVLKNLKNKINDNINSIKDFKPKKNKN